MRSEWALNEKALTSFLARLDPDSNRAGAEYERIRLLLIKFFSWRGVQFPEECADETLNRIIRKIDEGESIDDIST